MSEFYILDASALLCLLQEENGAERVARALPAAKIGAVNYSEVVGKLVEAGVDEAKIDRLVDALQADGGSVRPNPGAADRFASRRDAEARPLARRSRLPCAGFG